MVEEYQAAKSDQEKAKIVEQFNKFQADGSEKYLPIVKKHPDDEALFPALQALVGSGKHTLMAIDLLLKHHLDNPQMGMLCFQLGRQGTPGGEKLLRAVAEKSKSNDAKGVALLALGQSLFSQSNQGGVDDDKRDELRKQAQSALQSVVDDYADADVFGHKAGDMAGGILFEVQHLAIGQEVPDLEGEDLDGTAFKLSDYRGKVVFLDFWAHW
ncbi:MAG TPA: redoxin domain-containing protein [Pirellulales bacterium]|nr:redoxin domain-containing protein [Pirellulales bacterium]